MQAIYLLHFYLSNTYKSLSVLLVLVFIVLGVGWGCPRYFRQKYQSLIVEYNTWVSFFEIFYRDSMTDKVYIQHGEAYRRTHTNALQVPIVC